MFLIMKVKKFIAATIREYLNEVYLSNINKQIAHKILTATKFSDWINAVKMKYGEIVPLYHATTAENAEIIDRLGFKLVQGKSYISFSNDNILYFQLGKSDYVASNRPALYRLDVPITFLNNVDIDMDNVNVSEEELSKYVDLENWDALSHEIKDAITYFVWNGFELDGTELIVSDRFIDDGSNVFKNLKPIRLS